MHLFPSAAALFLCAPAALADVLEPGLVDARARVLVHVDVGALRDTTLFRLLAADPELGVEDALRRFEAEIGLDPLHDVRSLTVYSRETDERWVALLRTTAKLDQALAALQERPGYTRSVAGEKAIHSLREDGQEWHGHLHRSSAGDDRLFVLAEDVATLIEAVRVVDGEIESLLQGSEPAVGFQPSPGAVLFVSADRGLGELGGFHPSGEVSRLVTGVLFEAGEDRGELFASLRLSTATAKDAQDIHAVIQGALAFASLISGRTGEARALDDLVAALAVRRESLAVTFDFRYPARALYDGLRALAEDERR